MDRRSFIKTLLGGAAGLAGLNVIPKPVQVAAGSIYERMRELTGEKLKVLVELPDGIWLDVGGDVTHIELNTPVDLGRLGGTETIPSLKPKSEFVLTMDLTDQVWRAR